MRTQIEENNRESMTTEFVNHSVKEGVSALCRCVVAVSVPTAAVRFVVIAGSTAVISTVCVCVGVSGRERISVGSGDKWTHATIVAVKAKG